MKWLIACLVCLCMFSCKTASESAYSNYLAEARMKREAQLYSESNQTLLELTSRFPDSTLPKIELAYNLYLMDSCNQAIDLAKQFLNKAGDVGQDAYFIVGNSYDILEEVSLARQFYQEGIKKFPNNPVLPYNLALNFYGQQESDSALTAIELAIQNDPLNAPAHLLYAFTLEDQGRIVEAITSAYFFLILEPGSERSLQAIEFINSFYTGRNQDIAGGLGQVFDSETNLEFVETEMLLGMLEISNKNDKLAGAKDEELFILNASKFMQSLRKSRTDSSSGIIWNTYYPIVDTLSRSPYIKTFGFTAQQTTSDSAIEWMSQNSEEVNSYLNFMSGLLTQSKDE